MSTILKALQRLEDEKSAKVKRSLDEQVVSHHPPRDPEPNRRGLKLGIAAIACLALAAAAFLLWPGREDSDTLVAEESAPASVASAPEPAPAPAKQQVAAEKPRRKPATRKPPAARAQTDLSDAEAAAIVEVVKRLDEQPPAADARTASANRTAAAAEPERSTRRPNTRKPDARAADRAAKRRAAAEQAAAEKAAGAEAAATAKSVEPAAAIPEPVEIAAVAPIPTPVPESIPAPVRELEKKVVQRAKLPALSIEKTIWHPDTERRIAIIKLDDAEEVLRLKEGDAVGPLVIESIKPGSVLFNHDGIEIRYNVGG